MSISKEAVKAARLAVERAMRQRTYDRHAADEDVFRESVAHIASAALTAAAPFIAAQAKAEALKEFAVKLENIASIASYTGSEESMETWLNAAQHAHDAAAATTNRANNLEGKDS